MQNEHVSVDEAVARLLNLDFVPAPFGVMDLLEGFLQQAQVRYEEIPIDSDRQLLRKSRKAAFKVCESRLGLANVLLEAIESEIKQGNLIVKGGSSRVQLLSWGEIKDWAEDVFGLSVIERIEVRVKPSVSSTKTCNEDDQLDSIEEVLSTWGPRKAKNFLVTFYALALDLAFRNPKVMLTASRSVEKKPLAQEIEAIVKKHANSSTVVGQKHEAILDRLESAKAAWGQAIPVDGRSK